MINKVGDLLISISKNPMIDDNACRVFLYVFLQFVKNPGSNFVIINSQLAYKDIGVSHDVYEASSLMLDQQTILKRQIDNNQEIWEIRPCYHETKNE